MQRMDEKQTQTWKEQSSNFCTRLSHLCASSSASASILAPASGLRSSDITSCPASDSWSRVFLFFSNSSFKTYKMVGQKNVKATVNIETY